MLQKFCGLGYTRVTIKASVSWRFKAGSAIIASLILMVISNNVILFLTCAVIFVSFASIHIPLQQSIITKLAKENYGSLMGVFNSSKAIGQVTGSLTAEFIFDIGNKLPFLISAILVFISFIVLIPLNSNLILNNKYS